MVSLQPSLTKLLSSLPPSGPSPIDQEKLNVLVRGIVDESRGKSSAETRKSQWEYLLKNEVFQLAATEGKALKEKDETYYHRLRDQLDLVLTLTEHDACEQAFPFIVLQDLLETQTIASCSHIFSWIESRARRLTDGLVPQKGKALVLLRTLNDLLRRLSKMGNMTMFCGRILTFLSGVFPLGERSGVNLRGEYGPTWTDVELVKPKEEDTSDEDMKVKAEGQETKTTQASEQKDDFYHTFWSLQKYFSKPPEFAQPSAFAQFQEAVNKVLPVIKEATAKERAMMGSKAVAASNTSTLKRKRDVVENEEELSSTEYFFAKFLTSPELLDLEIADTHFRRQFLFQLLILLNHLLTFTKDAKSSWQTNRNRSLHMNFTLESEAEQWVQDTVNKAMEELRQTTPNGRAFAESAAVILEREKNWVKWKADLCAPFDKEPWAQEVEFDEAGEKKKRKVGLEEATKEIRVKMREPPKEWEWKYGSESLSDIWDWGYRELEDLQKPFNPGEVKDFVKKVQMENRRIELRTKTLRQQQERREAMKAAAAAAATPSSTSGTSSVDVEMKPIDAASESTTQVAPDASSDPPVAPSSLHPSLPAKPVASPRPSSPSKGPDPGTVASAASVISPSSSNSPAPAPTNSAPPPLPPDEHLTRAEESKQRWAWLALRTAREQHLAHFGKIGTGDIELLAQEIEKEKIAKEHDKEKGMNTLDDTTVGSASPAAIANRLPGAGESIIVDGEGDVKMEER